MIYSGNPALAFVCCYFHIDKAEARNWDSTHSSCPCCQHVGCRLKPGMQCLILVPEPWRNSFLVLNPTSTKTRKPRKVDKAVDSPPCTTFLHFGELALLLTHRGWLDWRGGQAVPWGGQAQSPAGSSLLGWDASHMLGILAADFSRT